MLKKNPIFTPRGLVTMALFIAVSIVLSRFCVIWITNSIRISFGNIPIFLAGILFGPVAGGVVGGLSDIIGSGLLSGLGWYPPLTISPVLIGVLSGFLRVLILKKLTYPRTLAVVLLPNIAASMLCTTYLLHTLYGTPFPALLAVRVPLYGAIAIAESFIIYHLCKSKLFTTLHVWPREGSYEH